jgi:ketosteroid isomerase-like protein
MPMNIDNQSPSSTQWDPDAFIEHLAAGWRLGEGSAFIEHFRPIVCADVISRQPLAKPQTGVEAFEKQFRDTFRLLPGITATIKHWDAVDPQVYVEWDLEAPARPRPYTMNSLDRFTLRDGKIAERAIFFDASKLVAFILTHPARWPAALKAR